MDTTKQQKEIEQLRQLLKDKQIFIEELGTLRDEECQEFEKFKTEHASTVEKYNLKLFEASTQIDDMKNSLLMEKEKFNNLAKKLSITEDNLRALRDCSMAAAQLDDSAIMETKDRADQLEFLLTEAQALRELREEENRELLANISKLEMQVKGLEEEVEYMNGVNSSLSAEVKEAKEEIAKLQSDLHMYKAGTHAERGNSMFSEVLEGREKQEREMVELYEEKERFRNLYAKVAAMLQENEANRQTACNKNILNGPTLNAFKRTRNEIYVCRHERDLLERRVVSLENLLKEKIADTNSCLRCKFRSVMMSDEMKVESLEHNIQKLEAYNRELMESVLYEKGRANSVPLLENKIETLTKIINQYDICFMKKDKENNENVAPKLNS